MKSEKQRRLQARKPSRGLTSVFFGNDGVPASTPPWVPIALFLVAVILLCYRYTTDLDLGFHLKTGQQIWQSRSIPKVDPFFFTERPELIAFPRSEWALLFCDDVAAIYAKRNGSNESIIRGKEIKSIQPLQLSTYLDAIAGDQEKQQLFTEELDLELRRHPDSYRLHFLSGIFAVKRGPALLPQAVDQFQRSISIKTDYVPAYYSLAAVCRYLGRIEEARSGYKTILALENNPLVAGELETMR
jgi:tetratricopeptide (TPR) repeat protein